MLKEEKDNLVKIYENSFRNNWELPALTDWGTTTTFTYGQLAEQIARLHVLFERVGLQKEDKVSLMGKNTANWCSVYLATVTYGAIIVPILQDFKAEDAIHIINHSESKLFFITDAIWDGMELEQMEQISAVWSLQNFKTIAGRLDEDLMSWEAAGEAMKAKYPNGFTAADVRYDERDNAAVASINYTSGTTGFSKGVVTPANALAGNIQYARESRLIFRGCRQVAFLPLAHAYGCAIDFLGSLSVGGHTYLIGRTPAPKILLKAFAEVKPTLILSVPLVLEKIYRKQIVPQIAKAPVSWVLKVPYLDKIVLNKIRQSLIDALGGEFSMVIIGGAPLNAEVEAFLTKIKFPVAVGYGMTECAPLISFTPYDSRYGTNGMAYRSYSCGQALKGLMEAKIDNPNHEGVGEILVRGENTMYGYYKNEEATEQAFTKDGWLRTGDLGVIDEDGYIFIKGRNKTMLLGASGQNIYPEEIEAKLNNMPYVMESLVIQQEEQLVALVYPDFESADANHLSHEQLEAFMEENRKVLNQQIASYEQVSKIKLYPHEFEKTPKKSIKRFLYTQG